MTWVTIILLVASLGWTVVSFLAYRDGHFAFQSSLVGWIIFAVFWVGSRLGLAGMRRSNGRSIGLATAGVLIVVSLGIFFFAVGGGRWIEKKSKGLLSIARTPATERSSTGRRLQPTTRGAPKGAPQKTEELWSVQVGAFRSEEDALKLAKMLKSKGYEAYVIRGEVNAVNFYRTKVGRFRTREAAQTLLTLLKDKEAYRTAFVARM